VTCTREFVMDWFAWHVTVGIPVLLVLMGLGQFPRFVGVAT
jgi:hypothetical protein